MKYPLLFISVLLIAFASCKKPNRDISDPLPEEEEFFVNEDPATFAEMGMIDVGGVGAAEISAYDSLTQRLLVVINDEENNVNKIEVIDMSKPAEMKVITSINVQPYGGMVNSVSVFDGKLAAAIESNDKQANGKVVVFKTTDYSEIKVIEVGALPDMVTWSPNGKYILTANEGEPNTDYTNDPKGTVSIISVDNNYAVNTIDFSAFAGQEAALKAKGFRVFGVGNDFLKDIEPEYVTISSDSKTAWVTLQENNAIAKIDIANKTLTDIFPLGFKNYNTDGNEIDPSDEDDAITARKVPVKGIFLPDAIAVLEDGGKPYLFTANEGDAREYDAFEEVKRVKNITLDPAAFSNWADLRKDENLGRLNITTTLGDTDGDGDFDELYSLGARSFSVWNGNTGEMVFDSKNELDKKTIAADLYDDGRSDDKSVEPEGLAIGKVGHKKVAFVGMERADAVAVYDVTNPTAPVFLQLLESGDAPEGVLIIPARQSPTKKTLLVVSSENDGVVKVYTPNTI
ncbi:alkaline phosphatase [Mucilaginibacter limnophilus]|uniref:Alkaline phosphatase n=1 Tax=Mucilaginibacter limnophilus TaxID=1932778 RepID=A0A3S2V3W3_9SPHI|nr:choice-of-anchor I family protein [Mucilaginibacter limnophilus]RVU02736.1 alkaline phosphatase [Mucilaginibacter limnophilus]